MTIREAKRVLIAGDGTCGFRESERYDEAIDTILRSLDRPTSLEREAAKLMLTLTPAIGEWHDAHKRTFNRMVAWRLAYNRKVKR